jgi:flagellar protein FliL
MAAQAVDADADPVGEDGAASQTKSKRSLRQLMVMAAGALLLLGAVGGGAYYFFFKPAAPSAETTAAPVAKPPTFLDLPEVMVNLSTAGNERTQYLKVKLVLELPDAAVVAQIQPLMPRVMDAFQVFLRELRPSDLDGSAGMYRLKEELTRRVNSAIAPHRVNAVLFKEMIIQ